MGDSIVIDTVLSTKGFQKGSAEIKTAITSLTKTAKNMASSIKSIVPAIIGVSSAFGVIQKAIGTYMSQHEVVSRKMEAVWTALGNLVGPIVEKVVDWVRAAVSYFIEFLRVLGLTGKTASQLSQKALNSTDKLKRTIAGFDELNVLNDTREFPLEDKKLPDWLKNLLDMLKNGEWEKLAEWLANKLNDIINNTDWEALGQKFAYYFAKVINSLARFIKTVDFHVLGNKLAEFLNQVFALDKETWKNLGLLLVAGITVPFDMLTGFLESFNPVDLAKAISNVIIGALESLTKSLSGADWETIGKNIVSLFKNIDWDGIAKAVWDLFSAAFDAVAKIDKQLPDWLKDVAFGILAIKTACEGIKGLSELHAFFTAVQNLEGKGVLGQLGNIIATVTSGAGTLKEACELAFGTIGAKFAGIGTVLGGVVIAAKAFFDMITGGFSWFKEILMLVGIAIAAVGAVILGVMASTAAFFAGIAAAVLTVVVFVVNYADQIKNAFNTLADWLKNIFCRDWTEVFGVHLGTVLNLAVGVIGGLLGGLKQILFGFMDIIQGVFTGNWKQAWEGLLGIVKGVINGIIGVVNGMLSAITNAVNAMCRLLSFNIDLPGGGSVGLNLPQFSTPQIPYLAEGGILKKGQVGLLEGSGTEAVVPLEKNTEWINKVADAFVARLNSGQYAIGGNAKALAAIDSIANAVAYRMPAIAAGGVTPYSVSMGGMMAGGYGISGDSELLNELRGLREDIMYLSEHMQFVADFGDGIRALARKITKEQRRNQISEGR